MGITSYTDLREKDYSKKPAEIVRKKRAEDSANSLMEVIKDVNQGQTALDITPTNPVMQETSPPPKTTVIFDPNKIKGGATPEATPKQTTQTPQGRTSFADFFGGLFGGNNNNDAPVEKPSLQWDPNLSATENYMNMMQQRGDYLKSEEDKAKKVAMLQSIGNGFSMFGDVAASLMGGRVTPNQNPYLDQSLNKMQQYDNQYMNELYAGFNQIFQQALADENAKVASEAEAEKIQGERDWRSNEAQKQRDFETEQNRFNRSLQYAKLNQAKEKTTKPYMQVGLGGKSYPLDEGQTRAMYLEAQQAFKTDKEFQKFLSDNGQDLKAMMFAFEQQPTEAVKNYVQAYAAYKYSKEQTQQTQNTRQYYNPNGFSPEYPMQRDPNMQYDDQGNLIINNDNVNTNPPNNISQKVNNATVKDQNPAPAGSGFKSMQDYVDSYKIAKSLIENAPTLNDALTALDGQFKKGSDQYNFIVERAKEFLTPEAFGEVNDKVPDYNGEQKDLINKYVSEEEVSPTIKNDVAEQKPTSNDNYRSMSYSEAAKIGDKNIKNSEAAISKSKEIKSKMIDALRKDGYNKDLIGVIESGAGANKLGFYFIDNPKVFLETLNKMPKNIKDEIEADKAGNRQAMLAKVIINMITDYESKIK